MNGLIALITVIAVFAIGIAISGAILMILWNAFMPAVFALPAIDFITGCAGALLLAVVGGAFKR